MSLTCIETLRGTTDQTKENGQRGRQRKERTRKRKRNKMKRRRMRKSKRKKKTKRKRQRKLNMKRKRNTMSMEMERKKKRNRKRQRKLNMKRNTMSMKRKRKKDEYDAYNEQGQETTNEIRRDQSRDTNRICTANKYNNKKVYELIPLPDHDMACQGAPLRLTRHVKEPP